MISEYLPVLLQIIVAAGFAVSALMGFFVSALLWPPRVCRQLIWALAPGIGAGMCSLIFFVFRTFLNFSLTIRYKQNNNSTYLPTYLCVVFVVLIAIGSRF